jgi:hypothetical protein
MSSEVETSLLASETKFENGKRFLDSIALRSISLGMTKALLAPLIVGFGSLCGAFAQESPTTLPSPAAAHSVRISFVPPPIEGTISLGIYDTKGKLVRVLHRESETDDFTIGHDALITTWDGKNEAGEDLPAGKYGARGYAVGALEIEGVAYFFNDWVTDEKSPRLKRITALALNGNELHLDAEFASGERADAVYDLAHGTVTRSETHNGSSAIQAAGLEGSVFDPVTSAIGKDHTLWVIDHPEKSSSELEVKQLSPAHEFLRRLSYQPSDPQPKAIAASLREDKIFVLEENSDLQRVRGLTLVATTTDGKNQQSVSDWKVDFEKKIVAHQDFSLENGKPIATPGKAAPEKITQALQPNPLKRDKPGSVEVEVGCDSDGSYLKTTDGLPLRTISETPHLTRVLLTSHGEKSIDVFQDDGAVVEQFRVSGADQMMAFDCGDFELK